MDLLRALWTFSWLTAAFAVLWMALLIVARLIRDAGEAGAERRRTQITATFLKLMQDDALGQMEVLEVRRHPDVLAEILLQAADLVRGPARDRLVGSLKTLGLDEALRRQVGRGAERKRLAAIEALGLFPSPENEAALRAWGRRVGGLVRMTAGKALLEMGARVNLDLVIEDMRQRREAWSGPLSDLLRLLAERQPADCLRHLGRPDLPVSLKALLAEALGHAKDYQVLPALAEAALHGEAAVRAASVASLGLLMHPAMEPVIAQAVDDEDWQVRGAAAHAAGRAGFEALIPRLVERLADPVWWVRFQAAEALTRLGPDARRILHDVAEANLGAASRAASLTLAERGL